MNPSSPAVRDAGPVRLCCGIRPASPSALANIARANSFTGLPAGTSRWRLAALLRGAARLLDLSPGMLRLLQHYIDQTFDIDWTQGSEPIICRPLVETATQLGRSERQIRNLEQALAQRGLLAWRDSGNHRRWGRRDHRTGRLTEAYGPTLAPLAARVREIEALAATARAEDQAHHRLRRQIAACRRRLRATLACCSESDDARVAEARLIAGQRLPARVTLAQLEEHHDTMKAATGALEIMVLDGVGPSGTAAIPAAEAEISSRPIPESPEEKKKYPAEAATRVGSDALMTALRRLSTQHGTCDEAIAACWREALLRGIDEKTWREACGHLGRKQTALCAAITAMNIGIRHEKAYFKALVDRGRHRQLNLDRSIRAILRRDTATRRDRTSAQNATPAACQQQPVVMDTGQPIAPAPDTATTNPASNPVGGRMSVENRRRVAA